ncbi:acyltransferase family protein [Prevotella sp. AGR2160]|uniref:acyltransferase family protein n=1 Tax=Prevotella sp. AGR2160 TaxID=1280674 RepID=UPI00041B6D74|nr:acyltransferase family protein [Prevotella sp. AGR2160]
MVKKERAVYLDTICGILIIHMIYTCHLPSFAAGLDTARQWPIFIIPGLVLGFFMSWFFFKSGMFYKEKPFREVLRSSAKRLLVPYIVFTIIGAICEILFRIGDPSLSTFGLITRPLYETLYDESPSWSLANWFLLSLFIVRIAFAALKKMKVNTIVIFTVSLLLAYAVNKLYYVIQPAPYVIMIGGKHLLLYIPYYWGNIFYGLVFYSLGLLLKDLQFNKYAFVIAAALYIIHFFYKSGIDVRADDVHGMFPAYPLAVVYSIAGIIVFNNIFKRFINKKIPLLTYVGKNSMIYYVTHYITLSVMFNVFVGDVSKRTDKPLLYIEGAIILTIALFIYDRIFTKTKAKRIIQG